MKLHRVICETCKHVWIDELQEATCDCLAVEDEIWNVEEIEVSSHQGINSLYQLITECLSPFQPGQLAHIGAKGVLGIIARCIRQMEDKLTIVSSTMVVLPDGTHVYALPETDADVIERLHDLVHVLVAQAMGAPSLGLASALGRKPSPNLVAYEEAAILAIQAYARALEEERQ